MGRRRAGTRGVPGRGAEACQDEDEGRAGTRDGGVQGRGAEAGRALQADGAEAGLADRAGRDGSLARMRGGGVQGRGAEACRADGAEAGRDEGRAGTRGRGMPDACRALQALLSMRFHVA